MAEPGSSLTFSTPDDPGAFAAWIEERTRSRFYVGLDVGQSVDPSALAVVERVTVPELQPGRRYMFAGATAVPWTTTLRLRHLERLPLKMNYVAQAKHVARMMDTAPLRTNARLFVDATGVGRGVVDLMRREGLRFTGVTITAGDSATTVGGNWRVSKLSLVSALQAKVHSEQLRIPRGLPESQALVEELQAFQTTFSAAGNAQFGAREGRHDDLVLAVAMAVFGAEHDERTRVRLGEWLHGMN